MGWQILIFVVLVATQAAYAHSGAEHRSGTAGKTNYGSVEDIIADALVDEIKSEISAETDEGKSELISDLQTAASQTQEGYWLESDRSSSSLEDENDALFSRDHSNANKRDDYYESLEKKSERSTYVPPPRKTFYAPPEVIDVSASMDDPMIRSSRDNDYYPKIEVIPDILPEGSQHKADSFDATPSEQFYKARPVLSPPWRYPNTRPLPKVEAPPAAVQGIPSDTLLPRAAALKSHGTYKMVTSHSNRPSAKSGSKIRSRSQSKSWTADHSKAPYTPKADQQEERMFQSSFPTVRGYGKKGIRQQFHEQGVHGPSSYKFGYNTGDKENPMARYEERDADGVVRGSYSYIDPRGHRQVVNYESHPHFGFSINQNNNFF